MTLAVVLRQHGGPEELRLETVDVRAPANDELRIRHTAIGVNFHDVYVRSGLYQTLALPGIPGIEAVGVVEDAGRDASAFAPGDRVAYVDAGYGAYSQARILSARHALRLPKSIGDEVAAATLLKGLTACMLVRRVYPVRRGATVLIHAAAGGVGQLLVRWAKHLGARVFATVGSEEKARIALDCGADEAILYRQEPFTERVRDLTSGKGVEVVYDSVGRDTFDQSLECVAFRGTVVNFGQSSGAIAPIAISRLAQRSLTVSRPMIFHFTRERADLEALAAETFAALEAGVIKARVALSLPLSRAADAHRALESRTTAGSIVLLPRPDATLLSEAELPGIEEAPREPDS